jgi:hypothetical protein
MFPLYRPLTARLVAGDSTEVMRPGQTKLNELERAILDRMVLSLPNLAPAIPRLHVLSREYTGVGSYTNFKVNDPIVSESSPVQLNEIINIPSVPHGLIALLFLEGGRVKVLEIAACGGLWDGVFEGFRIGTAA